jgi:substrate import-associated zinc metallohydrolase lipoprotein
MNKFMKYFRIILLFAATLGMFSCSSDDLDSTSIFDTTAPARNVFDKWLMTNYVTPYNISFNYKYSDKESNNTYNLVPADSTKAVALAIMMRHVWIDAYTELMGADFMKQYCPRVMQLIGSPAYNGNSELVLGTAEGGLKVTLYNVNVIDRDNPFIDATSPFVDKKTAIVDLNYWFFHTMHHEFCHILTQKKDYSTDFRTVSSANYKSTDWINVVDSVAPESGFVSGYASSEYNEDFADMFSIYVTHTAAAWQKILNKGVVAKTDSKGNALTDAKGNVIYDTTGRDAIVSKLAIMKDYFKGSWSIDMDKLRDIVLRRSAEVSTLDLKNLK